MSWHKFTGRYHKQYYLVRYQGIGLAVCWPNAGRMNEWGGENRSWGVEDGIEVLAIPDTGFKMKGDNE